MATLAIVGTLLAASLQQQHQATKQQKKASKEQASIGRAEAKRDRIRRIRERNLQEGAAINTAFTSGGQGSILSGAKASAGSQLGGGLGFNQGTEGASQRAATAQQKALDFSFNASALETTASFVGFAAGGGKSGPKTNPNSLLINTPKRRDPFQPFNG